MDPAEMVNDGLVLPLEPPTSEQVFATLHTEFGHCASSEFHTVSVHPAGTPLAPHEEQDPPYYILLSTYISYLLLIVLGHVRDFVGKRLTPARYKYLMPHDVSLFVRFVFQFLFRFSFGFVLCLECQQSFLSSPRFTYYLHFHPSSILIPFRSVLFGALVLHFRALVSTGFQFPFSIVLGAARSPYVVRGALKTVNMCPVLSRVHCTRISSLCFALASRTHIILLSTGYPARHSRGA